MAAASAQEVIVSRAGAVLGRQTILKDDHFPGCQNIRLSPLVEGAPNFRQVDGLPVYGVAIPTVSGLRNVLDAVGGKTRRVLWHSMREEPLVYINGQPFVLREVERPFSNLELTGITRERVEQMESRLREDVLVEASQYDGRVLVSKELDDGQVVDTWEVVHTVQTPLEVYQAFSTEGYSLSYVRIPITDEKAPKCLDCDMIAGRCAAADEGTALVFNCQMGRGRTTTAMIIAALVRCRLHPAPTQQTLLSASSPSSDDDKLMLQGDYAVVRSLVRVVEGGKEAKAAADKVIDRCAHMQNLREAILGYRRALGQEADEKRREAALLRGVEYLERYYTLIAFAAYVHDPLFTACSSASVECSFQSWMDKRPELQSILRRLLWRNPMGALMPPTVPGAETVASVPPSSDGGEAADAVVSGRAGGVLGAHCILKEEPYPGVQSAVLPVLHEGAPNFRQAACHAVFGVANSTLDGIRAVLAATGAANRASAPVQWYNMREEPCIYIDGRPFVLREATRPLANLREYTGIDSSRVELLEDRLKHDVLQELQRYRAVLVTRELADGQLVDVWIDAPPEAVKTPREVYDQLASEGIDVRYLRVPITHTRAPKGRDFDILASAIRGAPPLSSHVFNCQAGHGRTTTAMVVACMCLQLTLEPAPTAASTRSAAEDAAQGQWVVVGRLLRLLQGGHDAKAQLDAAIDQCASVVNLRDGILQEGGEPGQSKLSATKQLSHDKVHRDFLANRVKNLDLYCCLVTFAAWLRLGMPARSYKVWRKMRPEVHELRAFIRRNPMAALEFTHPVHGQALSDACPDADLAASHRTGRVLAPTTMLKRHFLAQAIEPPPAAAAGGGSGSELSDDEALQPPLTACVQVPRLCAAAMDLPVTCFATASVSAFRRWLDEDMDAGPDGSGACVYLTDLREELVVFIHGEPFTLREGHRPTQSIKMASIPGPAVEDLEARLKSDVLAEALACGGRILVHRESRPASALPATGDSLADDTGAAPVVEPYWQSVAPDGVLTPLELSVQLREEGFRLQYSRVPMSRSRNSVREKANDLDRLLSVLDSARLTGADAAFAIVSHTGIGTAGYAMAVSCCFLLATCSTPPRRVSQQFLVGSPETRHLDGCDGMRDVASLIRVLKFGPAAKDFVDRALEACAPACQHLDEELLAFLILATSFILGRRAAALEGRDDVHVGEGAFIAFFKDRAELGFLLSNIKRL